MFPVTCDGSNLSITAFFVWHNRKYCSSLCPVHFTHILLVSKLQILLNTLLNALCLWLICISVFWSHVWCILTMAQLHILSWNYFSSILRKSHVHILLRCGFFLDFLFITCFAIVFHTFSLYLTANLALETFSMQLYFSMAVCNATYPWSICRFHGYLFAKFIFIFILFKLVWVIFP